MRNAEESKIEGCKIMSCMEKENEEWSEESSIFTTSRRKKKKEEKNGLKLVKLSMFSFSISVEFNATRFLEGQLYKWV